MGCRKGRRLIQRHLDGDLKPERKAWLKAHLKDCPACNREFRQLSGAVQLMRKAASIRQTPDFGEALWAGVLDGLEKESLGERWKRRWWEFWGEIPIPSLRFIPIPALAGGIVVLAVVLLLSLLPRTDRWVPAYSPGELVIGFPQLLASGTDDRGSVLYYSSGVGVETRYPLETLDPAKVNYRLVPTSTIEVLELF
ncbi:zf-HC2 domain-containing protein [candidate division KSB1 bacterium]|nr:zf-HC2 domain-containing protein [candidate division KSB1 bacterium]